MGKLPLLYLPLFFKNYNLNELTNLSSYIILPKQPEFRDFKPGPVQGPNSGF